MGNFLLFLLLVLQPRGKIVRRRYAPRWKVYSQYFRVDFISNGKDVCNHVFSPVFWSWNLRKPKTWLAGFLHIWCPPIFWPFGLKIGSSCPENWPPTIFQKNLPMNVARPYFSLFKKFWVLDKYKVFFVSLKNQRLPKSKNSEECKFRFTLEQNHRIVENNDSRIKKSRIKFANKSCEYQIRDRRIFLLLLNYSRFFTRI